MSDNVVLRVLFRKDLEKIEDAVIKYPLGSHEIAQIAELAGRLKSLGFEIIPKLEQMLKEYGEDE